MIDIGGSNTAIHYSGGIAFRKSDPPPCGENRGIINRADHNCAGNRVTVAITIIDHIGDGARTSSGIIPSQIAVGDTTQCLLVLQ